MDGSGDRPTWVSRVRRRREALGTSQQALAARVGVSRQALAAIEAGRQVPSTSLALELARALGCRVEDLFANALPGRIDVRLPAEGPVAIPGRAVLGLVRGQWVAHPTGRTSTAADALIEAPATAQPLDDEERLSRNVLVAGCAPLLGVLADHVSRRFADVRVRWIHANSSRALDLLADGLVHVAGLHLFEESAASGTASLLRERFGDRPMLVVGLTRWRQGLLVRPGNPLSLREVGDLARVDGRFARREEGSGAAILLASRLRAEGLALPGGPPARDHREVAQLVRWDLADAGMAIETAALEAGLDFVPLTEERFDLVMHADVAAEQPVARFLDTLTDRSFRTEAAAIPGYDPSVAGRLTRVA